MEKEKLTLNDFHMLSLLGIGNYAKVILVRKKINSKLYALKVIKKVGEILKLNKDHAYLEKIVLVSHYICRIHVITHSYPSLEVVFRRKKNYILSYSIVLVENFLESSKELKDLANNSNN